MRHYKVYGNENTNLTLTEKAAEAYNGCDYAIREYSDGAYEIWHDNHAVRTGMTAEDINEYFESDCDKSLEEIAEAKAWAAAAAEKMHSEYMQKLQDVITAMTEEEKARLAAIPDYKTDISEVSDLKKKYNVSWNELRKIRDMIR